MRPLPFKRLLSGRTGVVLVVAILACALIGIVVGGSTTTACAACHTKRAASLQDSSHLAVSCYACHLPRGAWSYPAFKARELFVMYPAMVFGGPEKGAVTKTSGSACLDCHTDISGSSRVIERDGLRIKHSACAARAASCDVCHGGVAHGSRARGVVAMSMDDCSACHVREKAGLKCEDCHTARRDDDVRLATPFRVTHGKQWRTTHGLGELDLCKTCHEADSCVKCHGVAVPHTGDFGATHGQSYLKNKTSCATCHEVKSFCSDCHAMEMPHPDGFLKEHSGIAKGVEDPLCESCHIMTDCERCHAKHIHPGGSQGVPVPWPQPTAIPQPGRP